MEDHFGKYYNSKTRILWHIGFWLTFVLYYVLIIGSFEGESYSEVFVERLLDLPVKIVTTYFVLYVLIPHFLFRKKILLFTLFFILAMMVAGVLQKYYHYYIYNPLLRPHLTGTLTFQLYDILKIVLGIYPIVGLAAFIKVGKHWLEKDRASQKLEKEKVDAELKFLKSQIHPHFLFNTLNNLYALTLKKSDKAPEVVLKISDLLDYMLYESNTRTVALKKELDLIENYIHLEKIRYGEKLKVSYNIKGDVSGKSIPPLIILPFIENSFKHGVSQQLKEMWIAIDLEIIENRLILKVENSKSSLETGKDVQNYKEGIGLQNVKRRLELLYSENYELNISDEKDRFRIYLSFVMEEPLILEKA